MRQKTLEEVASPSTPGTSNTLRSAPPTCGSSRGLPHPNARGHYNARYLCLLHAAARPQMTAMRRRHAQNDWVSTYEVGTSFRPGLQKHHNLNLKHHNLKHQKVTYAIAKGSEKIASTLKFIKPRPLQTWLRICLCFD